MANESGNRKRTLPAWMNVNTNTSERTGDEFAAEIKPLNEAPYLNFNGNINYITDVAACDKACETLMKEAETVQEIVLGFDMEWPVDYRGSGKTALIQICAEEHICYLFHVSCMGQLPTALVRLLQFSKVKLVGINITNDLWKLSRDFGMIVKPIIESRVVDLGEFANKVLQSGQKWSLDRLTMHVLKMRIDKDNAVRKSNWKTQKLTDIQQSYAATDAYVSFTAIVQPPKVQNANEFTVILNNFSIRMCRIAHVLQVGRMSYKSALRLQKLIADNHKTAKYGIQDTIILVEHNPVYTIGIRSKDYSQETEDKLISLGAEFFRTNRGGLITFHGPGQLVAYPILNLKNYKLSVRWYVSKIEETVIDVCKELGLEAETSPHTGVWVGDSKICAVGLRASRFITSHGLALNCNTDLEWFSHIVPCGIEGKDVTSLTKELNREFTIEEAVPIFLQSFSKLFDCSLCNVPKEDADKLLADISHQDNNN